MPRSHQIESSPTIHELRDQAAREHQTLITCFHAVAAVVGRIAAAMHDQALEAILLELRSHVAAITGCSPEDSEFRTHLGAIEATLRKVTVRAEQLLAHIDDNYDGALDLW